MADSRVLAAVAIAVTWLYLLPTSSKVAASGVDASWQAGLPMVAHDRLQQGTDIVYTYGPLGFLATSVYVYTVPWLLATVATWAIALALPLVVYWLLRVSVRPALAGLLTAPLVTFVFLYTPVTTPSEWSLTASLLGLGLVVRGQTPRVWMVAGFGAVTSLLLLISPVGAMGAGIALLVASCQPSYQSGGWRRVAQQAATFVGAAAVSFLLFWVLLGQSLGNIAPWIRYSLGVVSGYGAAMGSSASPFHVLELLAAGALVIVTVALVWRSSARAPLARRISAIALYLVLGYVEYKHGFVRQDGGHMLGFFEYAALAPLAFLPWLRIRLTSPVVGLGLVAVFSLFIAGGPVFYGWDSLSAGLRGIREAYAPSDHTAALTDTLELVASGRERSKLARRGMQNVVRTAKFPAGLISSFEGQSVHISPWDASLEYGLQGTTWDPAPVFQDYAVYTTSLDELNADWFDGPDAADVVLRRPGLAIDNRLPRWEPPTATLSMLCRYRPDNDPVEGWMVLRHLDGSRCGEMERTGSATVAMGETFNPPPAAPGTILLARFSGITDGPVDRLMTTAFKGPEVRVDTADGHSWRFLPGTQSSWHVIDAPGCTISTLDGGTRPDTSSLRFWSKGGPGTFLADAVSSASIQVEYATIPFTC